MTDNGWLDYWNQDDFWGIRGLWKLNARVFLRRAQGVLSWGAEDTVLDIGSGPGELAFALAEQVKSVLAVDAAPRFVEAVRARARTAPNVAAAQLGADYTDLTVFERKFSLILCISVIQYYRNVAEVEALIRSAQQVVRPGGRMLLADLNVRRSRTGFVYDAACSLLAGVREGHASTLLRLAWGRWLAPCAYRRADQANRLLEFDEGEIEALVRRMGLKATILRRSLSIYANRPSLLIQF